ncbi:acyl-CoA dehydrogenase family protein [Microcella alkalica]|uniref:acyl-CoA dehydrogenase family protein n=1 Tax=Microcella alkalica TaxID=355930 RepID=UPI00145E20BB|nr:acyl-CoA dehydrogenase family protein [Microcella alkalica]
MTAEPSSVPSDAPTAVPPTVLTPELLQGIRDRAADYDARNAFFFDDLDELRAAGYLRPRSLTSAARDQRLLAAHAPATALGMTMHLVWMGVARDLAAAGDDSLRWVLDDCAAGELFAFAISEAGNDRVMTDSVTRAERVEGADGRTGWAVTGTKIFTSLSPAWTRLGIIARHHPAGAEPATPDPAPQIIHGFLTRTAPVTTPDRFEPHPAPGVTITPDWNTLGMRATQSHTTTLERAFIADEHVSRILPVGPTPDPLLLAISANFLTLMAAVYAGLADRALELVVESAHRRTSLKNGGAPQSADPDIRWRVADAALALDALAPQLEAVCRDRDHGVDRGSRWHRDLAGLKQRAVETARHVVDQAMRIAGGGAYRSSAELSRLQRDVLAGIYHPSDPEAVHATVAADLLGPLP